MFHNWLIELGDGRLPRPRFISLIILRVFPHEGPSTRGPTLFFFFLIFNLHTKKRKPNKKKPPFFVPV